jgi:hypothetical protein
MEKTDEIEQLRSLCKPCGNKKLESLMPVPSQTTTEMNNKSETPSLSQTRSKKVQGPRHLRKCLESMKESDEADPEKIEIALASSASLIMTASDLQIRILFLWGKFHETQLLTNLCTYF